MIWGESPDDYIDTEEEIESDEFMLGEDEKE